MLQLFAHENSNRPAARKERKPRGLREEKEGRLRAGFRVIKEILFEQTKRSDLVRRLKAKASRDAII